MKSTAVSLFFALASIPAEALQNSNNTPKMWKRRDWVASSLALLATSFTGSVEAFAAASGSTAANDPSVLTPTREEESVANVLFQDLSFSLDAFDTTVPVACWWPDNNDGIIASKSKPARYSHRISVQRIGQLLAQWNFIPSFASRDFVLEPTLSDRVFQGQLDSWEGPVVWLAHGYLGSRFDLSHLAETLAAAGFLCLAPEYPESLAASYDRRGGLDRATINQELLTQALPDAWNIKATRFGIVGHSLGTGTALQMGDASWARVCLAGLPRQRNGMAVAGNVLLVCSLNDGAVSLNRFGGQAAIPSDYELLVMNQDGSDSPVALPRRAAWVLDAPNAPNHISFLSAGVNDAMIDLLSPLLPVAQWANIPVLDFDKYQTSRDAGPTAALLHPVVLRYLQQEMNV